MSLLTFILFQSSPQVHVSSFLVEFNVFRSNKHSLLVRAVKVLDPRHGPVVLALAGVQLHSNPGSRGEVCAADKPDDPREVAGPDLDALPHHHPVLVLAVPLGVLVDVGL